MPPPNAALPRGRAHAWVVIVLLAALLACGACLALAALPAWAAPPGINRPELRTGKNYVMVNAGPLLASAAVNGYPDCSPVNCHLAPCRPTRTRTSPSGSAGPGRRSRTT
jgi:hypothetical protein